MAEQISLSELFSKSTRRVTIESIPTRSSHEKSARKILNSLLQSHADWFPCIAALTVYPIQIWASSARRSIGIDKSSLIRDIELNADFFGIQTAGRFRNHMISLEQTDAEILKVKKILSESLPEEPNLCQQMKVVRAIHSISDDDVSKFMIDKYYEDGIVSICRTHCNDFTALTKQTLEDMNYNDKENVFHNTDLLIRQLAAIEGKASDRQSGIDYSEVHRIVMECIDALKDYAVDGSEMNTVISYYAKGYRENKVSSMMGKSRNYVRQKYMNAVEILSYLIWGYATNDILKSSKN